MKRVGWVIVVMLAMGVVAVAQTHSFRGTVVRMKMSECTRQHGFVSAMSGVQVVTTHPCPEYTVMTDKVVYVLVGRKPEEFMPLAENVIFHVRKSDVVVISEDEKDEWHFAIRRMTLRSDWARDEVIPQLADRSVTYEADAPIAALMQTSSH